MLLKIRSFHFPDTFAVVASCSSCIGIFNYSRNMSLCLLRPGASGRGLGLDLGPALCWVQTPGGPGGEGRGAVSHKDDATSDHLQRASALREQRERERRRAKRVCTPSLLPLACDQHKRACTCPS